MSPPALPSSTGDDRADRFLRDMVAMFERAYPNRLKACYVVGSYAYGAAAPSSDLDLTVVFRDSFLDDTERRRATQSFLDHAVDWSGALDMDLQDEVTLRQTNGDSPVGPMLTYGSLLVYGEDIRDALPVLPVGNWARRAMHSGYWCIARGDGQPPIVTYPLSYPDPTGEFYGYDAPDHAPDVIAPERGRVRRSNRSDRFDQPGMRSLVTGILWAATGLIAHRAHVYVLRKRDVPALYARHIGGEWAEVLEELYRRCREEWDYAIPAEPAQRAHLRALCARVLGFENHVLARYKETLPDTLLAGDADDKLYALRFLRLKPFRDDDVIAALVGLCADENAEVRQGAEKMLKVIEGQDHQGR